jgi:hypothetical protein
VGGRERAIQVLPSVTLTVCSPGDLVVYMLISTRPRDHKDASGVMRRHGNALDVRYILGWLRQFELAFDDSPLISTFQRLLRGGRA